MKKFVSCIFAILFSLCLSLNLAAESSSQPLEDDVQSLLSGQNCSSSIVANYPLYDYNDTIVAYVFILQPTGYVIIDTLRTIPEFSLENPCPFEISDKTYYFGPLSYFKKVNSQYISVKDNTILNHSDMENLSKSYAEKRYTIVNANKKNRTAVNPYAIPDSKTLGYALRPYSYNTGDICGSTAAAILLMCYQDYIDSRVVAPAHRTSDGVALIKFLAQHIDNNSYPGSTAANVAVGLNYYLKNYRGITNFSASRSASNHFSAVRSQIANGYPIETLVNNAPTYGNHWVVAYGYTYTYAARFMIVNDGWGRMGINIDYQYVVGASWLIKS